MGDWASGIFDASAGCEEGPRSMRGAIEGARREMKHRSKVVTGESPRK